MQTIATRCCIAGGGPAGMMAGLLLARAGVDVVVIEKHADFFRDFRGDTIHPSTLQMLAEIGLLEEFLARPHDELAYLAGQVGTEVIALADFSHLPTACKFIAFMPQWDFLNFLREQAERFPSFRLMMQTELSALIFEDDRVVGLRANTPQGELEIRSDLVLGTDGRASIVRERANLHLRNLGAPMDVLWTRMPKGPQRHQQTFGIAGAGHILVLIDRKDYYQTGFVIAKGAYQELRAQPVEKLREAIVALAPFLKDSVTAIVSWDDVRFLEVRLDRLTQWYRSGVLCIGDAAHAMSPIGGVGINLAIQDAVAAANLLWQPLRSGAPDLSDLRAVQERRMYPTRATQAVQFLIQRVVVRAVLHAKSITRPPLALRILFSIPAVRRTIGRVMGLGFRREHIRSPLRARSSQ